jgi:hypothetical protein
MVVVGASVAWRAAVVVGDSVVSGGSAVLGASVVVSATAIVVATDGSMVDGVVCGAELLDGAKVVSSESIDGESSDPHADMTANDETATNAVRR